ncbi:MAG: Rne/Rng family ribonuclease [Candidatus Omnitrophota bacterium]|nr:Rne/Rng family ribonuclease [Candidatus Omnitrophota bacterium]
MTKEILINVKTNEMRVAVLKDGQLEDFSIELNKQNSILGDIYKGRIDSIVASINAAFVDIGFGKNGFLYLSEMTNPMLEAELSKPVGFLEKILHKPAKEVKKVSPEFQVGQEILVQVVKEPFGNKGPRLTTHISLPGRFLVLMPIDKQFGISRRIEDHSERQRLRSVLHSLSFAKEMGFIVRTASLGKGKKELLRDAKFLYMMWQRIKKMANQSKAPALIYQEYDLTWRVIRDTFTEDVDSLIVDSKQEFVKIHRFVRSLIGGHLSKKIRLYKEQTPLFEAKNIEKEIQRIYERKINLKSGAYIVIEPTEGLTVVDVNSGKFRSRLSPEDTAFQVNLEAAKEAARQLRFRDVGGIIVIDFIDMSREHHRRQVLAVLKEGLAGDHAKTDVLGISKLGLVEMTRERTGRSLESMSFSSCSYCRGTGRLKIAETQPDHIKK